MAKNKVFFLRPVGSPISALPQVTYASTKLDFPPPYDLAPIDGKVIFTCDPGYQLVGQAEVVCGIDSKWSRHPMCVKGIIFLSLFILF